MQNSWGPNWGDGGFFGIPYSYFDLQNTPLRGPFFSITECEVSIMPVPEYIPRNNLWLPSKAAIAAEISANTLNLQPFIDDLVLNKIGAAQLEATMEWPAGAIAEYKVANPQYNWTGLQP